MASMTGYSGAVRNGGEIQQPTSKQVGPSDTQYSSNWGTYDPNDVDMGNTNAVRGTGTALETLLATIGLGPLGAGAVLAGGAGVAGVNAAANAAQTAATSPESNSATAKQAAAINPANAPPNSAVGQAYTAQQTNQTNETAQQKQLDLLNQYAAEMQKPIDPNDPQWSSLLSPIRQGATLGGLNAGLGSGWAGRMADQSVIQAEANLNQQRSAQGLSALGMASQSANTINAQELQNTQFNQQLAQQVAQAQAASNQQQYQNQMNANAGWGSLIGGAAGLGASYFSDGKIPYNVGLSAGSSLGGGIFSAGTRQPTGYTTPTLMGGGNTMTGGSTYNPNSPYNVGSSPSSGVSAAGGNRSATLIGE